jgi:hypothetical protein
MRWVQSATAAKRERLLVVGGVIEQEIMTGVSCRPLSAFARDNARFPSLYIWDVIQGSIDVIFLE